MAPSFASVGVVVSDMAASLAFYRRLGLDIPPDADDRPHAECELPGGVKLLFDTEDTIRSFDESWHPPVDGQRLSVGFACDAPDEVDATHDAAVAAGSESHLEPWDAFWGQRYAVVCDPDGNHVELFAPLPAS